MLDIFEILAYSFQVASLKSFLRYGTRLIYIYYFLDWNVGGKHSRITSTSTFITKHRWQV